MTSCTGCSCLFCFCKEEVQPRNNCKPKRTFFQDASSTPHPLLGVRYCLAIQKSNVELFQISQSSFPFSQHPFRCKQSVPGPFLSGLSCLRRVRSQPSGCKAPQDCVQDGGCALPSCWERARPWGAKHLQTVLETAITTVTPVSPMGRAGVAER